MRFVSNQTMVREYNAMRRLGSQITTSCLTVQIRAGAGPQPGAAGNKPGSPSCCLCSCNSSFALVSTRRAVRIFCCCEDYACKMPQNNYDGKFVTDCSPIVIALA